jgi:hypothetical protein
LEIGGGEGRFIRFTTARVGPVVIAVDSLYLYGIEKLGVTCCIFIIRIIGLLFAFSTKKISTQNPEPNAQTLLHKFQFFISLVAIAFTMLQDQSQRVLSWCSKQARHKVSGIGISKNCIEGFLLENKNVCVEEIGKV